MLDISTEVTYNPYNSAPHDVSLPYHETSSDLWSFAHDVMLTMIPHLIWRLNDNLRLKFDQNSVQKHWPTPPQRGLVGYLIKFWRDIM